MGNLIKLKVYVNKRNNQGFVVLPKKKFKKLPDYIKVKGDLL